MQISPKRAEEILKEIEKGDFTHASIAKNSEAPLIARYLVILTRRAANPPSIGYPAATCVTADSVRKFIRQEFDLADMIRVARHIGYCSDCHTYFRDLEQDVACRPGLI